MTTYDQDPGQSGGDDLDEKSRQLSDEAADEYRQRIFVGVGVGEPVTEAIRRAYENAWRQASSADARGPFRVLEQHVDGTNPPNWCRVVLGAGS
ncbi:MAG: hypothetical protein ICV67_02300 [Thermoleophilia bacterium]|nr:hypothetical protein [Thermoleophilia bacterium]